jgi:hypothetical protein
MTHSGTVVGHSSSRRAVLKNRRTGHSFSRDIAKISFLSKPINTLSQFQPHTFSD